MDTERPFVGRHSPRVRLSPTEPHGIRRSRLRIGKKAYQARVVLAGDPGTKVTVRLSWGSEASDAQTITIPALHQQYQTFPLKFAPAAASDEASLEILGVGTGAFHIGAVSLMLVDTWRGFTQG